MCAVSNSCGVLPVVFWTLPMDLETHAQTVESKASFISALFALNKPVCGLSGQERLTSNAFLMLL